MKNAVLIPIKGEVIPIAPEINHEKTSGKFTLEELQQYVGDHVEIHPLANRKLLVVQAIPENNKIPLNGVATELFRQSYGEGVVVGDAVYCDNDLI